MSTCVYVGPVLHADCVGRRPGELDRGIHHGRVQLARPDVGQRHAERRRIGDDTVGHRQRVEVAASREGVDGELRAGHELLHEDDLPSRSGKRRLKGLRDVLCRHHDGQPTLALAVRRLDHAGRADSVRVLGVARTRAHARRRMRHAGLHETLALAKLRDRSLRHLG